MGQDRQLLGRVAPVHVHRGICLGVASSLCFGHRRRIVCALLLHLGQDEVAGAVEDGVDGLDKFRQIRPDLTFLDIVMPKQTGLDVLADIKKIDQAAVVIIVSSYVTKNNLLKAKEIGADWFLMKPFTRQKLVDIVAKF